MSTHTKERKPFKVQDSPALQHFLIKQCTGGALFSERPLKFFKMNLELLDNRCVNCNYIHTGKVGIQEVQ